MNPAEFVAKWKRVELKETSASQQHFLDLCEIFDHPKPAEADPKGEWFTFERGAAKHGGGDGWADVWKRGFFGWEYKGKRKDLGAAYDQLLLYKDALENPPLLVVCDMDRIVLHTNFTGTKPEIHDIPLADLGEPRNFEILRHVFHAPQKLKPGTTSEAITAEAASCVAEIAQALRDRGMPPPDVAHFLDRIVFCLFAEDVGLLPELLFTRLLEKTRHDPERFAKLTADLFDAMASGGDFGVDTIRRFNGNLFQPGPVLTLNPKEIESLYAAARLDWAAVDPSIFGTLFERGLDPDKRAQLGAHYTSREDIETLVEPVVMQPLRREWNETRGLVENLLTTGKKSPKGNETPPEGAKLRKAQSEAQILLRRFHERLAHVEVLDPACGSGNFLYVTLQKLKDLEKEVIVWAMERGFTAFIPLVGPWQLHGIELNQYAFELAQMTVWIGYLQWTRNNGFGHPNDPVLKPMGTFECKDAILDLSDPENPKEPEWPKVDFIVGNPPFLGGNKIRKELGGAYVEPLFKHFEGMVPGTADLCCYWFDKARRHLKDGRVARVGLLATQGIRGGANRTVLDRIKQNGEIFFGISDRPWILEGASVHVSLIGFDSGEEKKRQLDGKSVRSINTNLTSGVDVTQAKQISANAGVCVYGSQQKAQFDISPELARAMLIEPNPTGLPNSDVLRPSLNAAQLLRRTHETWVIDFGLEEDHSVAASYEAPYEYVREHILPVRQDRAEKRQREYWWLHARPSPRYREIQAVLPRCAVTPQVSKHRVFIWVDNALLMDHVTLVIRCADNYSLGVLQSRSHEIWARAQGTQVRERESGFRYTPKACFGTFPSPWPPGEEPEDDPLAGAIATAARELSVLRERWLNPSEWTREEVLEFPGSVDGPWSRYVHDADERGVGTVRWPRTVPRDDDCAEKLRRRTLTSLYNEHPTWLDLAHRKLDEAVFAAYGWSPEISDEEILERLLALNLERAATQEED